MKKLISGFLVFLCVMTLNPRLLVAEDKIPVELLSSKEQVVYFTELYGGNVDVANKVVECESNYNHSTQSDGGMSNGILQFQKETFTRMSKKFGEDLDYNSEFDQIKLGMWALTKPDLAREWSTYVAIKNGGVYKFYSRQNKRYYSIYCKV